MMGSIIFIALKNDGFSTPGDSLKVGYIKGLNTDKWWGNLQYQTYFSTGWSLSIFEAFSSSLLKLSSTEEKWKDENQLVFSTSRLLSPVFNLGFSGQSYYLSDKQSVFKNDIRTHSLGFGLTYAGSKISFPAFIGLKEDRRLEQRDIGPTLQLGTSLPSLELSKYRNTFQGAYEIDELQRRRNTTLSLAYQVSRQFYEETADTLRLNLDHFRRDYYITDEGLIESRMEKGQGAENILTYRIAPGLRLDIFGAISSRLLRIHQRNASENTLKRERKDFHSTGALSLYWKTSAFRGSANFTHTSEEQEYRLAESGTPSPYSGLDLITPDNRTSYTTLALRNQWRFLPTDSLILSTSLQRFRYDTPDPDNFDDRDELRFRCDIKEVHIFSPQLIFSLNASIYLHHFVYIYAERSADNNWTRIFRLGPAVTWRPLKNIQFTQSAEVMANYVDYDFESLLPSVRSFLYRRFYIEDSLRIYVSTRTNISAYYRLELDENGKLIWDDWVEQRLIDRESHIFTLGMEFEPLTGLRIGTGYSVYTRRGFRYKIDPDLVERRELSTDYRSQGPLFRIGYNGHRFAFLFSGSRTSYKTKNVPEQFLTRINLRMNWAL